MNSDAHRKSENVRISCLGMEAPSSDPEARECMEGVARLREEFVNSYTGDKAEGQRLYQALVTGFNLAGSPGMKKLLPNIKLGDTFEERFEVFEEGVRSPELKTICPKDGIASKPMEQPDSELWAGF